MWRKNSEKCLFAKVAISSDQDPEEKPLVSQGEEISDDVNTLRTGDADLRFYVTTMQDRFESHRGHGYLSVVSVVCCQVKVSATSWSLVQRSPTDCGASLCVI